MIGVAGLRRGRRRCARPRRSIEVLVAGRALQGVFGALLTPASLAIIVAAFPRARARAGDRHVDRVHRHRRGRRAARRRLARRHARLALDLRDQRAVRARHARARRARCRRPRAPARAAGRTGSARRSARVGLAGPTFGLIQQPEHGWGDPRVVAADRRRPRASSPRSSLWERRARDPMLPLGLFGARQLRVGQRRDARDVRRARRRCSSCSCSSSSRSPATARSRPGWRRCRRRSSCSLLSRRFGALADRLGPRLFMGVGPLVAAAGVAAAARARSTRTRRSSTDVLPGDARVLARPVDHRRAADRGDPRRRRRAQRRHRLGRQQRGRARRRPARDRGDRRGRRRRRSTSTASGWRSRSPPALLAVGGAVGLLGIRNPPRATCTPRSARAGSSRARRARPARRSGGCAGAGAERAAGRRRPPRERELRRAIAR